MKSRLERGVTISVTVVALALLLASSVVLASLARREPLISDDKRPGTTRAADGGPTITSSERSASPGR